MNNIIPIRRDPLRTLFETIDQYSDTDQSPEQKRITDEALALVQKMIESRNASDILSTPKHMLDAKWNKHFGIGEEGDGDPTLPAS